ncbi:MAG: hypothetical protein CM15mP18_1700 [Methanobacteriota archaeon]|nr:MAG: hypothetical protein CM15mP18_1700 [Euryarchaeota archaeon]
MLLPSLSEKSPPPEMAARGKRSSLFLLKAKRSLSVFFSEGPMLVCGHQESAWGRDR